MKKPSGDSAGSALFLSPEAPYPMAGGGAIRSASLLEWLASRFATDVVCFHPADFAGRGVRDALFLDLPRHSRTPAARAWRNVRRLARGVPPLVDRFSGFEKPLAGVLRGRRYQLGVIEHFWCAPYADILREHCDRVALDLHNVESQLASTAASAAAWPLSAAMRRFAAAYRRLEAQLLPRFDAVLTASAEDAARLPVASIVYPNALPPTPLPSAVPEDAVAFSGNLEYDANISAVRWLAGEIWPAVAARHPSTECRLIGKNPHAVARYAGGSVKLVGPVPNAVAELARVRVCLAPILQGSGTRLKILEAWAAGRPVVSTPLGAEGLGAGDGEHLLLASGATEFAAAVCRLLSDDALARRLGAAGRRLFEQRFVWPEAWRELDALAAVLRRPAP